MSSHLDRLRHLPRKLRDALAAVPSDKRWYALALVALSLIYLFPIWWFEFPKMLDYPAHLLMSRQLLEAITDPTGADWRVAPAAWPNIVFCVLNALLQTFMDANTAGKLLVSLAVLAMPLSLTFLMRRLSLPVWSALLALPLTTPLLDMGLCPYFMSLPLVFVGIGVAPSVTSLPRAAAFSGLAALTFFAHVNGFLILGPAALAMALASARQRWRTAFLVGLGYSAPALLLGLSWLTAAAGSSGWLPVDRSALLPLFPLSKLYSVLSHTTWLVYRWEYRLLVMVCCAFLAALLLFPRRRYPAVRFIPALVIALVAAFLPNTAMGVLFGERTLIAAAIAALLWIPLETVTPWRRVHVCVLIGLMGIHAAARVPSAREYDTSVGALRHLARALPSGSSILYLRAPAAHANPARRLTTWPFHHAHEYLYFWRRTRANLYPSNFGSTWVQNKPGRVHPLVGRIFPDSSDLLSAEARSVPFALLLTYDPLPPDLLGPFQPVYRAGLLTLYRNIRHEGARIVLPAVEEACKAAGLPDRPGSQVASCSHALRWKDADASCRRWGGRLFDAREASAPGREQAEPRWIDLTNWGLGGHRFARGEERLRGLPFAGALRRCVLSRRDQGWIPVPCGERGRPLCQPVPGQRFRPPATSRPLVIQGRQHWLLADELPFDEADRECRQRGGGLAVMSGPEMGREAMTISAEPFWLNLVQQHPEAGWTTLGEQPMGWAERLLVSLPVRPLCGQAGDPPVLKDCNSLARFSCLRQDHSSIR